MARPDSRAEAPAPAFLADSDPSEHPEHPANATQAVPELPVVRWLEDTQASGEETDAVESPPAGDDRGSPINSGRAGNGGSSRPLTSANPPASANPGPKGVSPPGWAEAGTAHPAVGYAPTPAHAPRAVESLELLDVEGDEDDEFIEQLRRMVDSGPPHQATEEAMAAFFDHDESAARPGGRGGPGSRHRP